MGKKRKVRDNAAEQVVQKKDEAQDRLKQTLFRWKDKVVDANGGEQSGHGPIFRSKEKVLVTCLRRITYRKLKDLYIWMAKSPSGPSVKFLANGVHTMEELKLTGNHLKDSRPILTFSSNFNSDPRWKLLKEMITQIFGTPKDHRKAKPFFDHVFSFSIADDHIWFRNFQIVGQGGIEKTTLVEVGPRFSLNPIRIFAGSFGGPNLYENPLYVSPNLIRAMEKKQKAGKYVKKIKAKTRRKMHEMSNPLLGDELADLWRE